MSDTSEIHFPLPAKERVDVLIVAGEHSGDEHAARMVTALLRRSPQTRVAAIGGPRLAAAGAQLLFDLTATSVVGLVEVLRHYGFFRRVFGETVRWIKQHRPSVVCFVDYPGFNLRLARALAKAKLAHKRGGPVRLVYYISPQIWAWKPRRRFAMARVLDALGVIFPFEVKSYADTSLAVRFVGHPFVASDYVPSLVHLATAPVLLLPGSRAAAVRRIAPMLLDGFTAYLRRTPEARAQMVFPSRLVRDLLQAELNLRPELAGRVQLQGNNVPAAASAVLTSSGTMSLVCALAGIPGAIAYRLNPVTYVLARHLVKVPYIGIANLLLPQPIYPEFVQGAASPPVLAAELADCVENPARLEHTRARAAELRQMLAQPTQGDAANWLAEQITAAQ
jgi:lipid-A-disaccharide synthase